MPDVSFSAPADVRVWVALDPHKLSIVAATLPASGGAPEVIEIENTPEAGTASSMLREPISWVLLVAGVASVFLAIVSAVPGWIGGAAVGVLVLVVAVYRSDDAKH